MQDKSSNPLLVAALEHASRGWPVFPVHTPAEDGGCSCGNPACTSVGKHPRTPHGLKDATTDPQIITQWWTQWPDANIALVTGKESGLVVLDVDPRHGGDESLEELERAEGPLPETVESKTGGGGRHIVLEYPAGGIRSRAGFASGLDLQSDGKYIIAPPSLHPSGERYEWELSSHPDDVPFAPMPPWLLARAGRPSKNGDRVLNESPGTIPQGRRNATLFKLGCGMRRKAMSEKAIRAALLAMNQECCAPPLDESEVERIAASAASYKPGDPLLISLESAEPAAPRPRIQVNGRQDAELLTEGRTVLAASRSPRIFHHTAGRLVRVSDGELRALSRGELQDLLARSARWVKIMHSKEGEDIKDAQVPRHLIDPLLEASSNEIPTVQRVIHVPAFVGDTVDLMSEEGYEAAAQTLYLGTALPMDPLPETPTPGNLMDAKEILESWFCEFDFCDVTARAHAIALLVTLLARHAIPGRIPMFLVEAATPGTGKTTLAEVICIAVYGEPPVSTAYTRDGEEMGKRAASWVLSGRPVAFLDDVARISGDPAHVLSSLITTGAIEVRAMRELRTTGGRWDGVLVATGNNVGLAEEMPRKICRIRLDSPEEPWTRRFKRHDLHAWTLENRSRIVWAIGVLIRAWKVIGAPDGENLRPSFMRWSQIVGGILACLDHALADAFLSEDELADMMTFGEGVEELRTFITAWLDDVDARGPAARKASDLVVIAEAAGVLEGVMQSKKDTSARSKATRLGNYLKRHRGKVILGHRIMGEKDRRSGALRWSLVIVEEAEK